jgi:hypothetical protein
MNGLFVLKDFKRREDGNVLFLILIAVALFAALSYAVTSSTRSGGGDASGETNLISSAQITQYPSSVSTAIVRMVIAGATVDELRFNIPSEFDDLDKTDIGVFHPSGGGATYITAPPDIMADGLVGQWTFNGDLEVPDIGTSGVDGNDIMAFLPGLKKNICSKINAEHGLGNTIPILNANRSADYLKRMYDDGSSDYVLPTTDMPDIDDGSGAFDGQPFGCFQNGGGAGQYVYYHVIVER